MADEIAIKELIEPRPQNMLAWAVFHLMVHGETTNKNFLERFNIDAANHDNTVKVELRINGIEVSPRVAFAELERQHDDMVKRHAEKLILEKCGEMNVVADLVYELEKYAKRRAAEALGINWQDRW